MRLHVGGEASLVGMDAADDPGTMDWWATATVSVWPEEDGDAAGEWWAAEGGGLRVHDRGGGERELVVLQACGLTVDLWRVDDVMDTLDARSGDDEHFAGMFGDRGGFGDVELHPDLEQMLEPGGSRVVIVDRVRLAPAWRGLGGVGRLLTARLLDWVCDDPRVVAVHPFPIELDEDAREDPARFDPALQRVCRVWRSLEFEPFTDDIWVLDPRKAAYGKAVEEIARTLGV